MTDAPASPRPSTRSPRLRVDDIAELAPTAATYIGRFEHNGRLDDLSPEGHARRYDAAKATLAALEAAEPVDDVDVVTKADLASTPPASSSNSTTRAITSATST